MSAWLHARLARLSIRHQLWGLFGLFLLAGAGVLVIDEIAQYRARQSLLSMRDDSLARMRGIKVVSDAYGLYVVDTTFRVRNYLIPWEDGVAVVDSARRRIDREWALLTPLPRDVRQRALFEEIGQARARADRAAAELRRILLARDIKALGRFADTELYPAVDPVTTRLAHLSDLALVQADAVVRDSLESNQRTSLLRISLSLLALLLVGLIGRHVLRNAYRGVESLTYLARQMRAHDYTAVPAYQPQGELATVMDAFLDMRRDVLGFETELTGQLARNERTRAELEHRELFQRSLHAAAQAAILAIDNEGRWSVFNPFAERMLGWRAEEVLGRVPRYGGAPQPDDSPMLISAQTIEATVARLSQKLGHEVAPDWRALFELAALRQPPGEAWLMHKDGHPVPVLMAMSALRDERGRPAGVIAVATDLTERRRLEQDLRESEARAQEANRAKSAFLATMSHEIRTPMIGVTGMLEVLAHSRLDHDQRHALNVIQQSSQALLQIIGDILDFSKIEAGRLELNPSVVSLPALLRSTVVNYSGAASSKGLTLDCEVDEHVGPAHHADPLRLRQILGNFLSNALKFTDEGGVHVALEASGRGPATGNGLGSDVLVFRVSDTGIGIDAEQQQHLFQPFRQAEDDTTRRFGGTGLGLVICRRLAELMGGEITMESVAGVGTTLRLTVTLERAPRDALPVEPPVLADAPAGIAPRRLPSVAEAERDGSLVLLVDDHPINRMVIARQLALAGYASESAEDGSAGLERWRSGRYALLLSDVHMPGLDGYELARAIRAEEAQRGLAPTPIIALTASALKGEAERCLAAGMNDYLVKPVSVPVLAASLQRWLPQTTGGPTVAADDAASATAVVPPPVAPSPALDQAALDQATLDQATLDELTGHSDSEARALLADFLDATVQDLVELAAARDAGDLEALTRQAHKIKGASSLVGAVELHATAAALEAAAHEQPSTGLASLVADVETAAQRLRQVVARRYDDAAHNP